MDNMFFVVSYQFHRKCDFHMDRKIDVIGTLSQNDETSSTFRHFHIRWTDEQYIPL
jgi:hypothetical protein